MALLQTDQKKKSSLLLSVTGLEWRAVFNKRVHARHFHAQWAAMATVTSSEEEKILYVIL